MTRHIFNATTGWQIRFWRAALDDLEGSGLINNPPVMNDRNSRKDLYISFVCWEYSGQLSSILGRIHSRLEKHQDGSDDDLKDRILDI